jgi:methyl-accepting chemotaxis protein
LLPILIPPMNVKIPVFDQNDQSYEKDVLLDHLEVEPAEPPGRSAEEGEDWEQYPAVNQEENEEPLEELESNEISPANLTSLPSLIQNVQTALSHSSESNTEMSQDLANLKTNAEFINENVVRAFEIADNLANTAKEAFELSENVQSGVKIVTDALGVSLQNTEELFSQSKKITRILEIMSDISEKIHILSINASIVSARAGVAGKGFEVVAKEIRNLAKETETSLLDIETVIEELQNTIGSVIDKVQVANKETEQEQSSLISVAGSLQGVILAVEIIRAVSSVARDKSSEQADLLKVLMEDAKKAEDQGINDGIPKLLGELQGIIDGLN